MGTSTDGRISFGIAFEEGFEFPWEADPNDFNDDIEDWWIYKIHCFKHSREVYGDGGRLPGVTDEDVSAYWAEKREFAQKHPLPVRLVNYCSGDFPMYIIAVPSSCLNNNRGYAVEFDPASLTVTDDERAALLKFFTDHGIEVSSEPKWLLTSYWG